MPKNNKNDNNTTTVVRTRRYDRRSRAASYNLINRTHNTSEELAHGR